MDGEMPHSYVIFSARFAPEVGGVETFTDSLSRSLASRGNEVVVVTSAISCDPGWEQDGQGVSILRLPCWPLMAGRLPVVKRGRQLRQLLDELCERRIERVLVNTRFYGISLLGLRFAQKMGLPAVVLDHGSSYLTLGNQASDALIKVYEHWITRRGKAFHPKYAGISSASARWLKTFGIDTDVVIPNSIDAQSFRGEASETNYRSLVMGDSEGILVVSIGRLTPEKGSDVLVTAARNLRGIAHVAIAGEGPLRNELEREIPPNVTLLGNLTHSELSALLRDADLFCLPTRSEGFCTSLLEAGAWGLLPVITHVGGTDEVMGDPVNYGWLLQDMRPQTVVSMIKEVAQSGALAHSKDLRAHVQRDCSWEAAVNALEAAYC